MRNILGQFVKGCASWNKGKKFSTDARKKMSLSKKGKHLSFKTEFKKGCIPWNKGKKMPQISGSKHPNWKGGLATYQNALWCRIRKHALGINKRYQLKYGGTHFSKYKNEEEKKQEYVRRRKERRHMLGISKKYISAPKGSKKGISYTKEYGTLQCQKRRCLEYEVGRLSIQTIQLVYEDNIKRYGMLTCYLCLQPISFGKDTLEHKIPLSRGGTNEYNNLAIACRSCNSKKHDKTEKEYQEVKKWQEP